MPIPTSTAVALVAVALLLLAQPGLGVPASPPAVVPDSINGESNTVIAGESWGVDVAMVWPAGVSTHGRSAAYARVRPNPLELPPNIPSVLSWACVRPQAAAFVSRGAGAVGVVGGAV